MNAAAPQSVFQVSASQQKHGDKQLKNPAHSAVDHKKSSRKRFASLLWRAFPSHSERDLSIKAASVLDVSPRQVVNWLRCENDAAVSYVFAVMAIAGAEIVFRQIESGQ